MVASLLSLILYDGYFRPHIQLIDAKMADRMAVEGLPDVRNLTFGDRFILKALVPHWSNKAWKLIWHGNAFVISLWTTFKQSIS
jgi:hypothetical protein